MEFEHFAELYSRLKVELQQAVLADPNPYPEQERIQQVNDGSIKLLDAIILAELLRARRPQRILEVGSFVGFSTRWLLEVTRDFASVLTSVDPNLRHRIFDVPGRILRTLNAEFVGTRLKSREGFFSRVIPGGFYYDYEHYKPCLSRAEMDRLIRSRPVFNAASFGGECFDFIFIDGDHSEEGALSDFTEAAKVLTPGGCIAFHDAISWPSVSSAIRKIALRYGLTATVGIRGSAFRAVLGAGACDGIGTFVSAAA
jgi:predicted O-methyltransferase YrrM